LISLSTVRRPLSKSLFRSVGDRRGVAGGSGVLTDRRVDIGG
jgi:hypothetical protein